MTIRVDKEMRKRIDEEKESWIYESPDGGKTVYRRRFGDTKRELCPNNNTFDEVSGVSLSRSLTENSTDEFYSEVMKIRTSLFRLERKIDNIVEILKSKGE